MPNDDKTLFVRVGADIGDYRRGMKETVAEAKKTQAEIARSVGGASAAFANFRATIFSVRSAIAAIGSAAVLRSIIDATQTMDRVRNTLLAVTGSAESAAREIEFINDLVVQLGLSLGETAFAWAKFNIATKSAGLSISEQKRIFVAFAEAARVLGLDAQRTGLVFLALEQIASKGTVAMEEIRRQLGDVLPGAMNIAAESLGVTTREFMRMVSANEVLARDLLPKMATLLEKRFGGAVEQSSKTIAASLGRMSTAWLKLFDTIGAGGYGQVLITIFEGIAKAISNPILLGTINLLGKGLKSLFDAVVTGVQFAFSPVVRFIGYIRTLKEIYDEFFFPKHGAELGGAGGFLERAIIEPPPPPVEVDTKKINEAVQTAFGGLRKKAAELEIEQLRLVGSEAAAVAKQVDLAMAEIREAVGPTLAAHLPGDLAARFTELFETIRTSEDAVEKLKLWKEQMAETTTAADLLDAEFKDVQETIDRFSAQSIAVEIGKIKNAFLVDLDVAGRTGGGLERVLDQTITAVESTLEALRRLGASTRFTETLNAQIRALEQALDRLRAASAIGEQQRELENLLLQIQAAEAITREERIQVELARSELELKRQGLQLTDAERQLTQDLITQRVNLTDVLQRYEDLRSTIEQSFTQTIRNIQTTFSDMWFNAATGGTRTMREFLVDLRNSFIRTIADIQGAIMTALVEQAIQSVTGLSIKELIQKATQAIAGGLVPGASQVKTEAQKVLEETKGFMDQLKAEQMIAARELQTAAMMLKEAALALQNAAGGGAGGQAPGGQNVPGAAPASPAGLEEQLIDIEPTDQGAGLDRLSEQMSEGLFDNLTDIFGDFFEFLEGSFADIGKWFQNLFGDIFSQLGSMLSGLFGGGGGGGGGFSWGSILTSVISYIGFAKKGAVWPRMSFAPVGYFQSGGIIDRPMVGFAGERAPMEKEAIVPLPDNRSIPVSFVGGRPMEENRPIQVNLTAVIHGVVDPKAMGKTDEDIIELITKGVDNDTPVRRAILKEVRRSSRD